MTLENRLLTILKENPYSITKFNRAIEKLSPLEVNQPFYKIWNHLIYQSDPRIDLISECALTPIKGSHLFTLAWSQSKFLSGETIYKPLFNTIDFLIKDDNVAISDLEHYAKSIKNNLITNEEIDAIEPYYVKRKPKRPAKLRYYALVSQVKFFDSFTKYPKMTDYQVFETEIACNVINLLNTDKLLLQKTLNLKLKEGSYFDYVECLLLKHSLDDKLKNTKNKKSHKI